MIKRGVAKAKCFVYALSVVNGPDHGKIFYYGSSYSPHKRFAQHQSGKVPETCDFIRKTWLSGAGITMRVIGVCKDKAKAQVIELVAILNSRCMTPTLNPEAQCPVDELPELLATNYILALAESSEQFKEFRKGECRPLAG